MLKNIVGKLLVGLDALGGDSIYQEANEISKDTSYRFLTRFGHGLKIKVVKKRYVLTRRKKSWLFRDKVYILYEVSCQLGDAFPEVMKEIFKGTYVMPRLLSKLISEENQINAVVTAYLDIHIDKLMEQYHAKKE